MVGLCERPAEVALAGSGCGPRGLDSEQELSCRRQDEEDVEQPQVPSMPVLGADYETEMEQKFALVIGDGRSSSSSAVSGQHCGLLWPVRAVSSFGTCLRPGRAPGTGSLPRSAGSRCRTSVDPAAGCETGVPGSSSGECLCQRKSTSLLYDERAQLFSRLATVPESPRPHRPLPTSVRPPSLTCPIGDAAKFLTKPPPVPTGLPASGLASLRARSLSQPSIAPGAAVSSLSCSDLHQRYHSYYVSSATGGRRPSELAGCGPSLVQPVPSAAGVVMALPSGAAPGPEPDVPLRQQSIGRRRSRFRRSLSSEVTAGSERRQQSREEREPSSWCSSLDRRGRASNRGQESSTRTAGWLWRSHSYHNVQSAGSRASSAQHSGDRLSCSSSLSVSSGPAVLRRGCNRCCTRGLMQTSSSSSDSVSRREATPPTSSCSTSVLPTSSPAGGSEVQGSWRRRGSLRRSVRALSGSWRTLLRQVGGMSQRSSSSSKPASIPAAPTPASDPPALSSPLPQARRVAPPSIPLEGGSGCRLSGGSFSSGYSGSHESGSSGGMAAGTVSGEGEGSARRYDGAAVGRYPPLSSNHYFSPPQQQPQQSAYNCSYTSLHHQGIPSAPGSSVAASSGSAVSGAISTCSGREFVPHFHNHLYPPHPHSASLTEDQGIDVQSPGRDSPSSSGDASCASGGCRHSSSSLDSGRASYDTIRPPGTAYTTTMTSAALSAPAPHGRYACHSLYDTAPSACCGPLHHHHQSPRHPDSITSSDDVISQLDVAQMLADGLPDEEVLNAWLTDIHFEEYYRLFVNSGYDLPTISRMTPEDLTAIGVTRPADRRRLTAEISRLRIPDRLPDFVPASLEQWLRLLQLPEYCQQLRAQGYSSVHEVTAVTWEDLEDIGISRLGHQKKIMLAIKRAKDILTGRRVPSIYQHQYTTQEIAIASSSETSSASDVSFQPPVSGPPQFRTFQQRHRAEQQLSSMCSCQHQLQHNSSRSQQQQQFQPEQLQPPACLSPPPPPAPQTHVQYQQQQQGLVLPEWTRPSPSASPRLSGTVVAAAAATVSHKPRPVAMIAASTRLPDFPTDAEPLSKPVLLKPAASAAHFPPPPPPLRVSADSSGSDGEAGSPAAVRRHKMAALGEQALAQCQVSGDAGSESDSWFPFANENAGTIRQKQHQPSSSQQPASSSHSGQQEASQKPEIKGDVLGDIDSMLAGLTDELDAMLQMDHESAVKAE